MLLLPTRSELRQAFHAWNADRVPTLAGALAYTSALALAPLLLIIIGVAGIFYQGAAVNNEIIGNINAAVGPQAGMLISDALTASEKSSQGYIAVLVGTVIALVAALGALKQLQGSANIIWNVKPTKGWSRKIVTQYVTLILLLALTGVLVLVSTVISAILSHQGVAINNLFGGYTFVLQIAQAVSSFGLIALAFSLLFKILPETYVAWKHVWFAGLFTALLFNVGKYLMAWYLGRGSVGSVYGAAGSFAAIMVWIFYATQIFLYGIELVKVRQRHDRSLHPAKG